MLLAFLVAAHAASAAASPPDACAVVEAVKTRTLFDNALLQVGNSKEKLLSAALHTEEQEENVEEVEGVNGLGATAPLDEAGYVAVSLLGCHEEMKKFIERIVAALGLTSCASGGADAVATVHDVNPGDPPVGTYADLQNEILAQLSQPHDPDCPWVVRGSCPGQMNCPVFPNDRRRRCILTTPLTTSPAMTTAAPATTTAAPATTTAAPATTTAAPATTTAAPATTTTSLPDATTTTSTTTVELCDMGMNVRPILKSSMITQNNLGGQGPNLQDPQGMVFKEAGQFQGENFDIVVENITQYVGTGGGQGGKFANIQLMGGSAASFTFSFRRTSDQAPLTLPEIHFALFDIDQSFAGKMTERYSISGHHALVVDPLAEVSVAPQAGGSIMISSTMGGSSCDNPSDPMNLEVKPCDQKGVMVNVDQRKRSAMVVYRNVAQFTLRLEATCSGTCNSGRVFYFTFASELEDLCPPPL